jgi:hypothetical protein
MKEANWKDCLLNNTTRKVTPDIPRAKSLIETAHARISIAPKVDKENCNFVFED